MSSRAWVLAKIGISGLVLWLIMTRVQWIYLFDVLLRVDWRWYVASFIIMIIQNLLSAHALRVIAVSTRVERSFLEVVRLTFWGFYFSFLGNWAGGVVRWKGISGRDDRRGEALVSLILDNYFMVLAYFAIFMGTFFQDSWYLWNPWERKMLVFYTGCIAIGSGVGAACLFSTKFLVSTDRIIDRMTTSVPALAWLRNKVADITRILRNAKNNWRMLLHVFLCWLLHAGLAILSLSVMSRAVGYTLPMLTTAWIIALVKLAQSIPVTLFGLGIIESVLLIVIGRLGHPAEMGLATGLLFSSCSIGAALIGGAWYLIHQMKIPHMIKEKA